MLECLCFGIIPSVLSSDICGAKNLGERYRSGMTGFEQMEEMGISCACKIVWIIISEGNESLATVQSPVLIVALEAPRRLFIQAWRCSCAMRIDLVLSRSYIQRGPRIRRSGLHLSEFHHLVTSLAILGENSVFRLTARTVYYLDLREQPLISAWTPITLGARKCSGQ